MIFTVYVLALALALLQNSKSAFSAFLQDTLLPPLSYFQNMFRDIQAVEYIVFPENEYHFLLPPWACTLLERQDDGTHVR